MKNNLLAAVAQLCTRQDVAQNLATVDLLADEASRRGAELLVLPENYPYIGSLPRKLEMAEALDHPGPVLQHAVQLARRHSFFLLLGGIPLRSDRPDRFFNTAILLDPHGDVCASYRKIHLFDIDLTDGPVFTESAYVAPGEDLVVTDAVGPKLGFSICYDLRFPELYRTLVELGAELVAAPAAFTMQTGKDHWFPLLRARAIENQVFMLAAAQFGPHTKTRTSYGKACIIDPWGAVLAQVPDQAGVALASLDLAHQRQIRQQLPCLHHRRLPTHRA